MMALITTGQSKQSAQCCTKIKGDRNIFEFNRLSYGEK